MSIAEATVDYLREHSLLLTTAESCTAGMILTLLSEVPGSGEFIECGYVVYSPQAKQRLLRVNPQTIERFNLTSVEVAREMVVGALHDSTTNVAVATTGILGPEDVDGIPAGTVCFAWAFQCAAGQFVYSRQMRFSGSRCEVQNQATEYALQGIQQFHRAALQRRGVRLMTDDADHPDLRSRDVPFREDMAYQLKVWRFERCGWYALVLLMVLAMAGLFSRGLISSRDVRSEDGLVRVQYEMFHRNGSTNSMRISLTAAPEATVELELAGDLLQGFSIDTLQPEPLRSRSAADGVRFWLQADKQGQVSLYLSLRGDGLGLYRSHISTPGSSGVTLSQFIFP